MHTLFWCVSRFINSRFRLYQKQSSVLCGGCLGGAFLYEEDVLFLWGSRYVQVLFTFFTQCFTKEKNVDCVGSLYDAFVFLMWESIIINDGHFAIITISVVRFLWCCQLVPRCRIIFDVHTLKTSFKLVLFVVFMADCPVAFKNTLG